MTNTERAKMSIVESSLLPFLSSILASIAAMPKTAYEVRVPVERIRGLRNRRRCCQADLLQGHVLGIVPLPTSRAVSAILILVVARAHLTLVTPAAAVDKAAAARVI